MPRFGVMVCGHGSRSQAAVDEFAVVAERLRPHFPDWPVEYGGRGLDRSYTAIWSEECAKARVQPYLNLQGLILAGEAILRSGTDEQKRRVTERLATRISKQGVLRVISQKYRTRAANRRDAAVVSMEADFFNILFIVDITNLQFLHILDGWSLSCEAANEQARRPEWSASEIPVQRSALLGLFETVYPTWQGYCQANK